MSRLMSQRDHVVEGAPKSSGVKYALHAARKPAHEAARSAIGARRNVHPPIGRIKQRRHLTLVLRAEGNNGVLDCIRRLRDCQTRREAGNTAAEIGIKAYFVMPGYLFQIGYS